MSGPVRAGLDRAHELVGHADRVVGVLEGDRAVGLAREGRVVALLDEGPGLLLLELLGIDEVEDVRVVDVEDDHLGRAPGLAARVVGDDPVRDEGVDARDREVVGERLASIDHAHDLVPKVLVVENPLDRRAHRWRQAGDLVDESGDRLRPGVRDVVAGPVEDPEAGLERRAAGGCAHPAIATREKRPQGGHEAGDDVEVGVASSGRVGERGCRLALAGRDEVRSEQARETRGLGTEERQALVAVDRRAAADHAQVEGEQLDLLGQARGRGRDLDPRGAEMGVAFRVGSQELEHERSRRAADGERDALVR